MHMSVTNGHAMLAAMSSPAPIPADDQLLEACLNTLSTLGRAVSAKLVAGTKPLLRLRVGGDRSAKIFTVRVTRTHLSYALASGLIDEARASSGNWMLFAPYVPTKVGAHLAGSGLSYVDAVGNCHIQTEAGHQLIAHIEGKKLARRPPNSGRLPSHLATLAILIQPTLLNKPVRALAAAAGIGKSAAAEHMRRLTDLGFVEHVRGEVRLLRHHELLDRWLSAYADTVRPAWLIGHYRTRTVDPPTLEQEISAACEGRTWALGGGAAAWQMTHFYRGPQTVLHLHGSHKDVIDKLKAVPDQSGPLTLLRTPGALAYEGASPNLVHPLLVYSEMTGSADPRMLEAAGQLRQRFMPESAT